MLRRCLIFVFVFFFCVYNHSQTAEEIDSKNAVNTVLAITTKLKHYHKIEPNQDSIFAIINRGKNYTEQYLDLIKLPNKDTITANTFARFYDELGFYYFEKSDYLNALRYFNWALGIYEQTKSQKQEAYNSQNVAAVFRQIGDDSEALKYGQRALLLFESIKDEEGMAITLYTLAILFRELDDVQTANNYAEKALSIYNQLDAAEGKARVYNLLAGIYCDFKEEEKALSYYFESLKIYEGLKYVQGVSNLLNNIGVVYRDQEKFEESKNYLKRAIALSDSVGYQRGKVFGMVNLAEVNYKSGDLQSAKKTGLEALSLARKILDMESVKKGSEFLIKVYQKESNWEKAFEMQEVVLETEKQISKGKKEKILEYEAIRFNYEKEKILEEKEREKENSISAFQKDRQKIILIAAGVIISLLLISLLIGYIRLKESKSKNIKIQKQSDERKLLLQEVHHRVKNNFQIVSSLLRLQYYTLENKEFSKIFEEAIMRINAMSVVHDIIYRQEAFSEINAQVYFDKLLDQLKRLSDKDIQTEALISCGHLKIETLIHLGIITNELFINSIKYGFSGSTENPSVKIVLTENGDCFELNYFENGKGISKNEYESSFGMDLISTVIEQHEGKATLENPSEPWNTHIRVEFIEDVNLK